MPLPKTESCSRLLLAAALTGVLLPASVAVAETKIVTGIEVAVEAGFKLTVPSIEMEDSSLTEEAVRAIFAGDFAATSGQLSELAATSIRVPEIRLVSEFPGPDGVLQHTEFVYRDLELTDVAGGIAGVASLGGVEITGGHGVVLTLGAMAYGQFDIGGLLGLYGLGARANDTQMRPIYADFTFEGMQLASPEATCDFGAVRTGELSARPVTPPMSEIMAAIQQMDARQQAGEQPDPATMTKVVNYYADLFTAFETGAAAFDGFSCSAKDPDGKEVRVVTGPVTIDAVTPGIYPAIAVNDFRIDVENDGWMELGNLTMKSMDFTGAIAALRAATTLDEAWFAANFRKLLPVFEGFAAAGFSVDIPDPNSPGQRIQAGVDSFDVSLSDYVNGIPARVGLSASGIQVALPAQDAELAELGLDRLDLGYDVALHWDEAASTIIVDRFVVSDGTLGSVKLTSTLGNATADLFSEDPMKAAAASMGLTLKDLEIEIADEGMIDLLIALAAKDQGQRPVVFRAALSGIVQALPLAALGPSEEAMAVGAELSAFVDGKPNLKLTLTSTDPAGIGLAELEAAQQDPSMLAGKIAIAATASGEPRTVAPSQTDPASETEPEEDPAADEASPLTGEKQEAKRATR